MRDAPALDIIPALKAAGAVIRAFDPESMHEAEKMLSGVHYCKSPWEALEGADAMVIITEWDQFRALDLDRVRRALKHPIVVDLRNIYSPEDMAKRGFSYTSIGRPVTA
jgi:UDPglucose 6-dehydrogenase